MADLREWKWRRAQLKALKNVIDALAPRASDSLIKFNKKEFHFADISLKDYVFIKFNEHTRGLRRNTKTKGQKSLQYFQMKRLKTLISAEYSHGLPPYLVDSLINILKRHNTEC